MERDDTHPPSAVPVAQEPAPHGPGPEVPGTASNRRTDTRPATTTGKTGGLDPRRLAPRVIVAAFLVLQSSYGDGAKLVVARWAPQLVSTPPSPPENLPSPAPPAPATFQVAAAESVPAKAPPPPRVTTLAQAAPQDAAPAAPATTPDQTQLLQTIARDLANLERNIEQLRTNQQQMASDNAKAIADLKANQDEMKRALARTSDQAPARATPPPAQPVPALRKPERPRPQVRARPRYPYPQEWIYDDW